MPQSKIRHYLKHGTLPQLSVFEAVARLGNYTRAAEELNMAQPTVSVQIKKLSESIGQPLFEQVGRKVCLTETGRELQVTCREVFQSLVALEDRLADLRGLASGRLWLAATTTAMSFAPRMLAAFIKEHPGIDVILHGNNRRTLLERLAANADDLYIFANRPDDAEVIVQQILPNPLVVFARADHPLARVNNIPFERLAQEPFLIREPGSGTRAATLEFYDRHGLQPRIRMELSTNEAIMQAILGGLGVSIMSRYTLGLNAQPSDLVILDVEGFPLERHWYFVYPIGKQLPAAARAFMDFTRKHVQEVVLDNASREHREHVETEPA